MKMCEVNSARFFRPWNAEESEKRIDEDSDALSWTSELESCQFGGEMNQDFVTELPASRRRRSVSLGSYSSTGSLDEPSSAIKKLSHCDQNKTVHQQIENSLTIGDQKIIVPANTSEANSPSAFSPIYQIAPYPSFDFPVDCQPHHVNWLLPKWPTKQIEQMSILYGLASMPITTYRVEEAFKYVQQQDAAAKQLKKLRPKKFRCHHCDVAFSNNGQLKGHIRIHTGERPFKCDTVGCNKAFTRNEELTRHKKIHTGSKPHLCNVCTKPFGRKDHLKKHQRTHQNRGQPSHFGAPMMGYVNHFQALPPTAHQFSQYRYNL